MNKRSMSARIRSFVCGTALAAAALCVTQEASAQDLAAAANAFSQAQKAELGGDYAGAAELYELADSAAPALEALRSAMRARRAAGQMGMAAVHAEAVIERYPEDKRSVEAAEAILKEAKQKLVRASVKCQPRACTIAVDGAIVNPSAREEHVLYLDTSSHELVASFGGQAADPQTLSGQAGEEVELTFDAPPEPVRAPGSTDAVGAEASGAVGVDGGVVDKGGLPPWVFIAGAAVTVGLGAATVWSGLDTQKAHDDYQDVKNDRARAQDAFDDGNKKELRTNILLGGAAVAAIGTGIVAILTDWDGKPETSTQARGLRSVRVGGHMAPQGGFMSVGGNF